MKNERMMMKLNDNDQKEYYFDTVFAGVNLNKLEGQISAIVAAAFGLFFSVYELIEHINNKKSI